MTTLRTQANASGTGSITLATPNTSNNRTLTLPDVTGTVATTTDSITQAQLATVLNASGSAPLYACRAWVNFNGTGTVAIRASGNVSSITDNGAGDYTVNFTTAMPDANYCAQIACKYGSAGSMAGAYSMGLMEIARTSNALQTGSIRFWGSYGSDTVLYDREEVHVAIHR